MPKKGILQREACSDRKNTPATMWMEEYKNHRSGSVPGSHSPVRGDTAEAADIRIYGIPEEEEQHYAVWAIRGTEVQVPQQRILVQGVLCGYGRKERDPNCGVYKELTERGQIRWTDDDSLYWPVYGRQVTIPAQLADRITRLRVTRGTEGFARIGRTPSFTGGLLFYRGSTLSAVLYRAADGVLSLSMKKFQVLYREL